MNIIGCFVWPELALSLEAYFGVNVIFITSFLDLCIYIYVDISDFSFQIMFLRAFTETGL